MPTWTMNVIRQQGVTEVIIWHSIMITDDVKPLILINWLQIMFLDMELSLMILILSYYLLQSFPRETTDKTRARWYTVLERIW